MKFLLFLFVILSTVGFSQEKSKDLSVGEIISADSIVIDAGKKDSLKVFKPTIYDYRFSKEYGQKSILDTVMTYDKTYIFTRYNNEDNLGKIKFDNIGAGFNPILFENNPKQNLTVLPTNKSYVIIGEKEVNYYDVKTPTTLFVFHNGVREGAALKTTYTQNIGKRFNFALEYMGLRSKGNYANSLAANNTTLFSSHYTNKKNNYEIFAHFIHQNINNQENGGIVRDDLFLDENESSINRQNMEVNLSGSNSRYSYRRYYLTHQFSLFQSEKFPFKIRHTIFHQGNKYRYEQTSIQKYFAENAGANSPELIDKYPIDAIKYDNNLSNVFAIVFDDEKIKFDAGFRYQIKSLGVTQNTDESKRTLPNEMTEHRLGIVGNTQLKLWDKIALNSFIEYSNGKEWGNYLNSKNDFTLTVFNDYRLKGKANFQSSVPHFNYLVNGSIYKKYNFHWTDYKPQNTLEIGGELGLKWFNSKVFANYFIIDNFTYLDANAQPKQSAEDLHLSQVGGEVLLDYRKFHLNTKVIFQKVLTNEELLPLPELIGRVNLFYQTKAFKNAAEIQTGVKTTYFTSFKSRAFMPIFNEYVLQDNNTNFQIGNKPLIDAYFNLKVKRMFVFLEGQNLIGLIKNKSYTAPHYPFSDIRINLGIVWYMVH